MDLHILGDVRIEGNGRIIGLDRAAERCVLATFALKPGRPLHIDALIDNVWGDQQPAQAEETVATYIRAVRRAIGLAGGDRDSIVNRRPRAYELRIDPTVIDYHRFVALAAEGDSRVRADDHDGAIAAYREALDLWRGDPLADVGGDWADRTRHTLRQERLSTLCALFEAQLRAGEYAAVATRAAHLLNDIIPTDRIIALALHGLAYSGHQSMIPEFVERAARRMWAAARVRPGPDIAVLARRLLAETIVVDPGEQFRPPRRVPPAATAEREHSDHEKPFPVVMNATNNENVYQSAGDMYVSDS